MVLSMTGFGRASLQRDGRELSVELKSVNHRYLDLGVRMPRHIGFLEDEIRRILASRLSRGHIDVFLTYRNTRNDARTVVVDNALLGAYLEAAKQCADMYAIENDITIQFALKLPDVTDIVEADEDREQLAQLLSDVLNSACDELITMRSIEGERLCKDLVERFAVVGRLRDSIASKAPIVVSDYRKRLNERIEALLAELEIDRARLATELALFADRASVDEELVRLSSHIAAALELLANGAAVGRKLDFIVQEINREFNTIGSKANDGDIAALVIDGKAELEKIREQIQNLE